MFKKMISMLFFALFVLILSCKKQQANSETIAVSLPQPDSLFEAPHLEQAYLESIFRAQTTIVYRPMDKAARQSFLNSAYLSASHMLITVGVVKMTKDGEIIPRALVRRAAVLDAKRWAAYGKSWLIYNNEPDFGKLNVFYKGYSKIMMPFTRHDSLFVPIVLRIY